MAKKKAADAQPEVQDVHDSQLAGSLEAAREELYKKYESETSPEEEVAAEETEEGAEVEDFKPEEEVSGDKPEEEKTVPLGALHEEREKRKSAQSELREMREQMRALMEDNRKLMEIVSKKEEPEEPIEDYDKEILNLKRQNAELLDRISKFEKKSVEFEQKTELETLNKTIESLDTSLEKEGYPGLMKFQGLVAQEIENLRKTDIGRYEDIMSSKENWLKGCGEIYKSKVFPEINQVVTKVSQSKKVQLKEKANLAGRTGKAEGKKDDEDKEWTYDDYLKERQKVSIFGMGGL